MACFLPTPIPTKFYLSPSLRMLREKKSLGESCSDPIDTHRCTIFGYSGGSFLWYNPQTLPIGMKSGVDKATENLLILWKPGQSRHCC